MSDVTDGGSNGGKYFISCGASLISTAHIVHILCTVKKCQIKFAGPVSE